MMMSFNDFIHKYRLTNKATLNIKIQQILSSLSSSDVGIFLRDGPFATDEEIVNLHPTNGTHWVAYINQNYFDSYGCSLPNKLSKFILRGIGSCLYSEYKIESLRHKRDAYCAACCLNIIYLKKVLGMDFKSAVLNLYYEPIS